MANFKRQKADGTWEVVFIDSDTVTTINGKTGEITKEEIEAWGFTGGTSTSTTTTLTLADGWNAANPTKWGGLRLIRVGDMHKLSGIISKATVSGAGTDVSVGNDFSYLEYQQNIVGSDATGQIYSFYISPDGALRVGDKSVLANVLIYF